MNSANHIKNFIGPGKVFIFSKTYCPFCDDAKNLFSNLDIPFGKVEVDKSNFDNAFVDSLHKASGFRTYPKIFIGEKCIGGCDELMKLYKNMKLFDLLKAEGVPIPDA